ncbi:MAG: alpha-L-rhamnosidase N-terminal domain-containing protein, partial [Monoglobales bacterium]
MKFIAASSNNYSKQNIPPAPYFRKKFTIDFVAESCIIKIATPGFYRLFINGTEITKGALAPYISNPDHFYCFDEYEISEYLNIGENAIGIILGNGFSNPCFHTLGLQEITECSPVKAALSLCAENGDKKFCLESDSTFKTAPSPLLFDMYRYGVVYDARLEIKGWNLADFDDSLWTNAVETTAPEGELVPCAANPIICKKELFPVSVTKQSDFYYLHTSLLPNSS